jgi:hypothetical protein
MKIKATLLSLLAAGVMSMSLTVVAHHGDAGRYEDKLTTIKGTVVELQLINPHSVIVLDVKGEDGAVVTWRGEAGSSTQLKGWCWTKDVIKVGDTVTMTGRRLKNGSPYMTLSENARVIDANDKVIYKGNDPGQPNEPGPCAPARTGGGR